MKNSLLHILVTYKCPLKCKFCMVSDLLGSKDIDITEKSLKNLHELINTSSKIVFSGEGETIMARDKVLQIMKLPGKERNFEIITSGSLQIEKLILFLKQVEEQIVLNNDKCNIRISLDSFHYEKMEELGLELVYGQIIEQFSKNIFSKKLTISFRSITGEYNFIYKVFEKISKQIGINNIIEEKSNLFYNVKFGNLEIPLYFKNIINLSQAEITDSSPIDIYIKDIEKGLGKPLTFGKFSKNKEGISDLSVTVNTNGDVVLYGLEHKILGNIGTDKINYKIIKEKLFLDLSLKIFYEIPFSKILYKLRQNKNIKKLIENINNPFWIMRKAEEKYPGLAESIIEKEFYNKEKNS